MVIDTSALIAILLGEPESPSLAKAIASDAVRLISTFSFLETSIVIEAKKGEAGNWIYSFIRLRSRLFPL